MTHRIVPGVPASVDTRPSQEDMNAYRNQIVSKLLVLDDESVHKDQLKTFCDDAGIIGIRPLSSSNDHLMPILKSNVDLGGILLYENYGGPGEGVSLAREIHRARPELPIFLRRQHVGSVAGLEERDAAIFRDAYVLSDLEQLKAKLNSSLFSRIYPNDLVRGINQLTRDSLQTLFKNCEITIDTPYLVKDRIIYGEVFTLVSIDSNWCRGYMMLQAAEEDLLTLIQQTFADDAMTFRDMNNVLGEATNMIWGAFKNRYVPNTNFMDAKFLTQVPIIVNHQRRYISFGSDDPQLCLKYSLRSTTRPNAPTVSLYQRFVFNLNWSPEDFVENPSIDSYVDSGELELF